MLQTPSPILLSKTDVPQDEDAIFRAKVVGKDQAGIENALIESKNGLFILFTPTIGTPQMISPEGDIPEGLIPKEKMASFETTVKPRVITTHKMPESNVSCVLIRSQEHRPKAEDSKAFVDEVHYQALLKKNPHRIIERVISEELFAQLANKNMPAAFYYYKPKGETQYQFSAIFGKQINAKVGNKLSDPGTYHNRVEDLNIVNKMLSEIGLRSVEEIIVLEDINQESKREYKLKL